MPRIMNETRVRPPPKIWYVAGSLEAFPVEYPWHGQSGAGRAAARPARFLLAFRKPGEGLVRGDVRRQPGGGAARYGDPAVHRQAGVADEIGRASCRGRV